MARESPSAFSLELESELALAYARSRREAEARAAVLQLLDAAGQLPPLTFGRDTALFNAITTIWELGAAEHANTARLLLEKTIAAGAGGSHTASPQLALARLHGLIGNLELSRDEFSKERNRLDGAGMRPLHAILDHDEAVAIAAGGAGFAEAGMLLARAIRQFDELGMLGWAERSRALISQGFDDASGPGGRLFFSYPAGLSRREVDVVRLMAAGSTRDEAARAMNIEEPVVDRHLTAALEKLGAADLDELPRFARRYGLVSA